MATAVSLKFAARRASIARFVRRHTVKAAYILYVVAVCWLLVLPHDQHSQHTYVSENALLPGQTRRFYGSKQVSVASRVASSARKHANDIADLRARFVEKEFLACGLKAGTQRFLLGTKLSNKTFPAVNAYGILSAPRSDGTESMVLVAPWISRDGVSVNADGIGTVVSLACLMKQHEFWSKDVIFLVADEQATGVQTWLEAYHGTDQSHYNTVDSLEYRSGAIQAAVSLDFKGDAHYSSFGILSEGVNGQLANLDLINTVVAISQMEGVYTTLHDKPPLTVDSGYGVGVDEYLSASATVARMMAHQASGFPSGAHGPFHRYKIDAITVYGHPADDRNGHAFGFLRIGQIIESTFRSINNLLEHLHQSFFLYLLSRADKYISIGLYIPPLIIVVVSMVMIAISLWTASASIAAASTADDTGELKLGPANEVLCGPPYTRRDPRTFAGPVVLVLLSYGCGLFIFSMVTSDVLGLLLDPETAVRAVILLASTAHIMTAFVLIPLVRRRIHGVLYPSGRTETDRAAEWAVAKCSALTVVAVTLTGLAVLNYSLSVALSVTVVVPYMLLRRTRQWLDTVVQIMLVLALSPPALVLGLSLATGTSPSKLVTTLTAGYDALGVWTLPFVCVVYWPSNVMFSALGGGGE